MSQWPPARQLPPALLWLLYISAAMQECALKVHALTPDPQGMVSGGKASGG